MIFFYSPLHFPMFCLFILLLRLPPPLFAVSYLLYVLLQLPDEQYSQDSFKASEVFLSLFRVEALDEVKGYHFKFWYNIYCFWLKYRQIIYFYAMHWAREISIENRFERKSYSSIFPGFMKAGFMKILFKLKQQNVCFHLPIKLGKTCFKVNVWMSSHESVLYFLLTNLNPY